MAYNLSMLLVYRKTEQDELTNDQLNFLRHLVKERLQ